MKVKKKFSYEGVELRIVERDEYATPYVVPMKMLRVLSPHNMVVPVQIKHKQTLKSIVEDTIKLLDGFKKMGANVVEELNNCK